MPGCPGAQFFTPTTCDKLLQPRYDFVVDCTNPIEPMEPLSRWKDLEVLRIAALDLLGETSLETVGASLADLADGLLGAATTTSRLTAELAVIAMGKLGARELNYGSDIDVVLVGGGDPQPLVNLVRQAWRTDLGLRPEGRSGPLVRSLASYLAYRDRWAQTWEFQALLKARPAAGSPELGAGFAEQAATRVWGRPLGADDLRALRAMKARTERAVALQGLSQREIKLGRGGIRDIEFAVQLLQLVHGRDDPTLRAPATLAALEALAAGGYVARPDADGLAGRLQVPPGCRTPAPAGQKTARCTLCPPAPRREPTWHTCIGYRDGPSATALALFEADLARHQATARSIHERLFFRPLLEVFSAPPAEEGLGADPPRKRAPGSVRLSLMPPAPAPQFSN